MVYGSAILRLYSQDMFSFQRHTVTSHSTSLVFILNLRSEVIYVKIYYILYSSTWNYNLQGTHNFLNRSDENAHYLQYALTNTY
jgi:hypothetical protein